MYSSCTPIILFLFTLISCTSSSDSVKDTVQISSDFNQYFEQYQVDGAIAIYDYNRHQWLLSDSSEVARATLPASTFKILNTLIILESGIISSENDTLRWVGETDTVKYGNRPEIYRDMTLKEAFQQSAVWVYLDLSTKINRDTYRKYVAESGYGNGDLSEPDVDFWNFGNFGVTPVQTVQFLKRLYQENLPFSPHNMKIVKDIMKIEEKGDINWYAKIGWTSVNNTNIGWWVGYVITKDIFRELGLNL